MAGVHGGGHGRPEVDVAQAHDQVLGVEDDALHIINRRQSIDPSNEFDVVRTPGRIVPDRLHVLVDGLVDRRVLPGQRQVDHPRRGLEVIEAAQPLLGRLQEVEQPGLVERAVVAADLQRPDPGGQVDDAGQVHPLQFEVEGVDPQPQLQVQDDRAVLDQEVPVALPPVGDLRPGAMGVQASQDPLVVDRRRAAARFGRGKPQQGLLLSLGPGRLGVRDHLEAQGVARRELADLPQVGGDHHKGTDEATQGRAVGSQDDRHVAGEVDRADGVGVVVDVRGMQARLAAIPARPLRPGPHQANPRSVGIVVHLPFDPADHGDVGRREEVRRPVGSGQDADAPGPGEGGRRGDGQGTLPGLFRGQSQDITGRQGPPRMTPEAPQGEGAAAAQVFGYIEPAADRQVGAQAGPGEPPQPEGLPGGDLEGRHGLHRRTVQCRGDLGPRQACGRRSVEQQGGAQGRDLEAGGGIGIAQETVGQPEGQGVHRS